MPGWGGDPRPAAAAAAAADRLGRGGFLRACARSLQEIADRLGDGVLGDLAALLLPVMGPDLPARADPLFEISWSWCSDNAVRKRRVHMRRDKGTVTVAAIRLWLRG